MNRLSLSGFAAALSAVSLVLLTLPLQAHAALYGDFASPGGAVTFRNVADLNGLFGVPTVTNNELHFSPDAFEADCASSATCPPTPASATDTLTFLVDVAAGFYIPRIILEEQGSTLIDDAGLPAGFAATTVVANVFVDILELDGVSVSGINANASMNFTSLGTYATNEEGNGTHLWSGNLFLNMDNFIAAAGQVGRATLVEISLANTLTAYAENGAVAFIEKNDINGLAVKLVPEPGTGLLMGLGLAGLAASRRRHL